jgi:hypothetical protein
MAFQATVDSLSSILERHGWVSELAGILPLSALIDFIDMPPKLHILELFGREYLACMWPFAEFRTR